MRKLRIISFAMCIMMIISCVVSCFVALAEEIEDEELLMSEELMESEVEDSEENSEIDISDEDTDSENNTYPEGEINEPEDNPVDVETVKVDANDLRLLNSLGVIKGNENMSENVTRAEFARIIYNVVKNLYDWTDTSNAYYYDVSSNSEYFVAVSLLNQAGIMRGTSENYFSPEELVTPNQVAIVAMRIAGYSEIIEQSDKWPGVFEKFRSKYDLATGNASSKSMTFAEICEFVCNMLDIPMLTDSLNGELQIGNTTVLCQYFEFIRKSGTVVADRYSSYKGRSTVAEKELVLQEDGKDYIYSVLCEIPDDLVGAKCDFYTNKNSEIEVIINTGKQNEITVAIEDISDINDSLTKLTYYDGNKKKSISINDSADLIYNGKNKYDITAEMIKSMSGYLRLVCESGSSCDIMYIYSFDYYLVDEVTKSGVIVDKRPELSYDTNIEDTKSDVRVYRNGLEIEFGMIAENDVVCVGESSDKEIIRLYVLQGTRNGTVTAKGDDTIEIDGKEFELSNSVDVNDFYLSQPIIFGRDMFGKIACYIPTEHSLSYGYLLDIAPENQSLRKRLCIKLYTQAEEVKIFQLAEKFYLNDVKSTIENAYGILAPAEETRQQLVSYQINSEGEIDRLYYALGEYDESHIGVKTLAENKSLKLNFINDGGRIGNSYNSMQGKFLKDKNTCVFYVMCDSDNEIIEDASYVIQNGSAKTRSNLYSTLYVYDAYESDYTAKVIVYKLDEADHISIYPVKTNAFILDRILNGTDEDGCEVKIAEGFFNGAVVKYAIDDSVSCNDWKRGDIFRIWLDRSNHIIKTHRIFSFTDHGDSNSLYMNKVYDSAAILNFSETSTEAKTGDNTSVCTILFGTLKGMNTRGSNQAVIVEMEADQSTWVYATITSTKYYRYNLDWGEITPIEASELKHIGQKVLLITRYGNVRDAIIFD